MRVLTWNGLFGGGGAQAIGSGESRDISMDLFRIPKHQRLIKYTHQ